MTNTSSTTRTTTGPEVGADVAVWRSLAESARLALSTLEPRELTSTQVNAVLAQVVVLERLAGSARVLLSKRAAESDQWRRDGFRSASEWLAAQQGTSTARAKADLATSELLDGLEGTKEKMRDGSLSPDQAAAVADAASVNPDAEADLLGLADGSHCAGCVMRRPAVAPSERRASVVGSGSIAADRPVRGPTVTARGTSLRWAPQTGARGSSWSGSA